MYILYTCTFYKCAINCTLPLQATSFKFVITIKNAIFVTLQTFLMLCLWRFGVRS